MLIAAFGCSRECVLALFIISIHLCITETRSSSSSNAVAGQEQDRQKLNNASLSKASEFDPAAVQIGSNNAAADNSGSSVTNQRSEQQQLHVAKAQLQTASDSLSIADGRAITETASEAEHHSSMKIYFILLVIGLSSLVVHLLNVLQCHFLPESIAVIFVGGLIGLALKLFTSDAASARWKQEAFFPPTAFFLIMLPPIIFESGYNLQKGAFFKNIGSILVFAVFGTLISALVIGAGVYLLGLMEIVYSLPAVECFEFGAIISAVDPVATIAIFKALNVHPTLHMLVFGESILNDAVAIVLASTIQEIKYQHFSSAAPSGIGALIFGVRRFMIMFFASAFLGVAFGLLSALALKHINFRQQPALEFAVMLIFSYMPYGLAEGISLSGIMAILACGVVMSHYTHYNLSPATQITMQQTLRSLAFMAETCVFAYLGLALMSFQPSDFHVSLIIWSLILVLVARAGNIYPLAHVINRYRMKPEKISKPMMFVMWFSGLRGAVAYALALHMQFSTGGGADVAVNNVAALNAAERRQAVVTTVLAIVLFTTIGMGGLTSPMLKYLRRYYSEQDDDDCSVVQQQHPNGVLKSRRRRRRPILLSKTTYDDDDDDMTDFDYDADENDENASSTAVNCDEISLLSTNGGISTNAVRYSPLLQPPISTNVSAESVLIGGRVAAPSSADGAVAATPAAGVLRYSNGFERFDAKYLRPIFLRQRKARELMIDAEQLQLQLRRLTTAGGRWVRAQLEDIGEEISDAYARSRSRLTVPGGLAHNHLPESTNVNNILVTPEPDDFVVSNGDAERRYANSVPLSVPTEDD